MAKRFFDTTRLDQEWYLTLSLKERELLRYCESKCDNAGVFSFSAKIASAYIGEIVNESSLKSLPVVKLPNGKFFLNNFIRDQYTKLSESSPAHNPVFSSISENLKKENFDFNTLSYTLSDTLFNRVQVKDKDKDKDKDEDKDKGLSIIERGEHPIQKYIKENLQNVSGLKIQLTNENCETLLSEFPKNLIQEKLEAMENKTDLTKKYKSVFLTLKSWCELELKNPKINTTYGNAKPSRADIFLRETAAAIERSDFEGDKFIQDNFKNQEL